MQTEHTLDPLPQTPFCPPRVTSHLSNWHSASVVVHVVLQSVELFDQRQKVEDGPLLPYTYMFSERPYAQMWMQMQRSGDGLLHICVCSSANQ